jgi:predicted  nucleic acid-binding Zn-ribbon protein
MADTAPSILNFVRQKAQEGEQWAKLHTHLKEIAALDVDAEKQKVEEAKVEQAQLAEQLQQEKNFLKAANEDRKKAQEAAANVLKDAQTELDNAAQRGADIVQKAHSEALVAASTAAEAVSAKLAERDQVQADITNLTAQKQELLEAHTKLQATHDDLVRKHAALQDALNKMAPNL